MGNCGIGFAPCQADRREFLATLMEAIEDIPLNVTQAGLDYDFETFEEYMDSIERKPLACDVGLMVGHCAVRTWCASFSQLQNSSSEAVDKQVQTYIKSVIC
jgi:N-acyl-D-aspartate/D-glutamate deacylase